MTWRHWLRSPDQMSFPLTSDIPDQMKQKSPWTSILLCWNHGAAHLYHHHFFSNFNCILKFCPFFSSQTNTQRCECALLGSDFQLLLRATQSCSFSILSAVILGKTWRAGLDRLRSEHWQSNKIYGLFVPQNICSIKAFLFKPVTPS